MSPVTYPCPQPIAVLYCYMCLPMGFRLMLLLMNLCNNFHYNVVSFSASQQSPCNSVKICEAKVYKVCCELRVLSAYGFKFASLVFYAVYIMWDRIIMGISCILFLLVTKLWQAACQIKLPSSRCLLPHLLGSMDIAMVSLNISQYQISMPVLFVTGLDFLPISIVFIFAVFNMCREFCLTQKAVTKR